MAEAGWFRDPQDPSSEVYFDGQNWTSYRRAATPAAQPTPPVSPAPVSPQPPAPPAQNPPAWQAPAPEWGAPPTAATPQWLPPTTGGGWGTPEPAPWAPSAPPARKRRTPLLLVLAAVVLAAAGLITWLAWPSDDAPTITYAGKAIDKADATLATAEQRLQTYVKSRHGAQNGETRCYFSRPDTPKAGGKKTDVDDKLTCGPVLFVDGDTAKPYVTIPLTADTSGKKATLSTPTQLTELAPQALPASAKLERPDGKEAPSGTGGLKVPPPPAADKDVLTTATLGPTPPPKSLSGARVVGKTTGFSVDAAGEIPRYGAGDEARSAPAGQKLIAFQIDYTSGDVSVAGNGHAQLIVDGGTPKTLPGTAGGDEWIVAAVPTAGKAVLQLDDGGYRQTLSLPDGKPGSENLAVLARTHRTAPARKTASIPVRISNSNGSANLTLHARMSFASLDFWAPGHESVHAPDGAHALLTASVTYTRSGSSSTFGFEPALLRLRLPSGELIRPRNIASGNRIFNVFTVPASFTSGTVVVSGSERVGGVTLRITRAENFPISIPAG